MNNLIELAKKLKELMIRGEDGEKINAEAFLKKLMAKHHITEEDLDDDKEEMHFFTIDVRREIVEGTLLSQICGTYGLALKGMFSKSLMQQHSLPGNFAVKCTNVQYLEIEAKFSFYQSQMALRLEEFLYAFLYKNNLLAEAKGEISISDEEKEKVVNSMYLAMNMVKNDYHKQLKNG